jgi:glycerate-2-kinase
LPAPVDGITLADKLEVTRFLSAAGADITELNTVRKHLSSVKGGGLLHACRAGELVTLVLSDVLGDPLDLIASGPTVPDTSSARDALAVLSKYDPAKSLDDRIYQTLTRQQTNSTTHQRELCKYTTIVIGNNAVAVDEAGIRAEKLGYNHAMQSARTCEGAAEEVGHQLAKMTVGMLRADPKAHRTDCLITGGEPTVTLAPESERGRGGRNQQLVLAAYQHLLAMQMTPQQWERLCILSGGTDGEDGPTDAAGAILDADVHRRASELGLDVEDHLRRNDAYAFFDQAGGLLMTGPTGTNVCDVRVSVVAGE